MGNTQSTAAFLRAPIVDTKTGLPSRDFLKFLQYIVAKTDTTLELDGTLASDIQISGDTSNASLLAKTRNLDANGIILANGVDLSRAYTNKNQDNIPDGANYSRVLGSYVASGIPYSYKGAWNSATSYNKGDEVSDGGNYWLALAASTNSAPAVGNASWQLLGPQSLDHVNDGTTYSRLLATYAKNGVPYNYKGTWSSTTAYVQGDEVSDQGNYWLALANNTNSEPAIGNGNWTLLGPQDLDKLQDGSIYLRSPISAGAQNLVENGNFEADTNLPPAGWQNGMGAPAFISGAALSWDTTTPYAGSRSLVIASSGGNAGAAVIRNYSVVAGEQYYLEFAAKYVSGSVGMSADIRAANQSGGISDLAITIPTNATSWTIYNGTITIPSGATFIVLYFYSINGASTVEIDSVKLVRMQATPDLVNNAVSESSSVSGGVVVLTNLNQWYTGSSVTIVGGGVCSLVSFSAEISNLASVGETLNWQLIRGATVLASGVINMPNGNPPTRAYYFLPNQNVIDVGPPAGSNTYSLQLENTTTGTGTDVQFENSRVAAVSLNR